MTVVPPPPERLEIIESLLVRQFRASQSLLRLARQEQSALLAGDATRLMSLASRKEMLLDRLSTLEAAFATQLAGLTDPLRPGPATLPLESLKEINPEAAGRVDRIYQGVQVLAGQARELAHANRALAAVALQRAHTQQAGLVLSARTSLPALCAAILDARDALDAQDQTAVQAAVGDLQEALTPLWSERKSAESGSPQPGTGAETGLVEAMAGLYRQEKAYQAVMRVSSRIIAGV